MRFKLPGSRVHVRLFERVETTNDTYDIFDSGVDFSDADGNIRKIDSIAVGGSFASAKAAIKSYDEKQSAKQDSKKADKSAESAAVTA